MENDDEYEVIFNDDEVVDVILYDKVEKELDEKKNTGCFTAFLFQVVLCLGCCFLF